ncbi:MAG: hypothetical protein Q7S40_00090 [Opitutaceae bacterium]|nr:hypothetical protein [Opitutaceae bacterium]
MKSGIGHLKSENFQTIGIRCGFPISRCPMTDARLADVASLGTRFPGTWKTLAAYGAAEGGQA